MKLVFDLDNLNRTAEFLVQKNSVVRERDDNPIRHVINQLAANVEKHVSGNTLDQLTKDSARGVMYLVDGHSQVCYWLGLTDADRRDLNNPSLRMLNDPYTDTQQYWTKQLPEVAPQFAGYTTAVHFYIRPGRQPSNMTPGDDE